MQVSVSAQPCLYGSRWDSCPKRTLLARPSSGPLTPVESYIHFYLRFPYRAPGDSAGTEQMPQPNGQSSFLPWGSEGAEWIGQKEEGCEAETMHTVSSNEAVGKATISSNNEETAAPRLRKDRVERRHTVGTTAERAAERSPRSPCGSGTEAAALCWAASCANTPILDITRSFLIKGTFPSLLISATSVKIYALQAGTCCTEKHCRVLVDFCYSAVWIEYVLN